MVRGFAWGAAAKHESRSGMSTNIRVYSSPQRVVRFGLTVAVFGMACGSPLAPPERLAAMRPELQFLEFQRGRMRDGGIVFVEMAPTDTSFRLAPGEYLPITVTSRAGESEDLRLRSEICGLESGQSYLCNFLSVSVQSGHDVREIEADMQRLNARLTLVAPTPTYGSAYAFGDWNRTMSSVRKLPNVINVDFVRLYESGPVFIPFASRLAAAAPFSRGTPSPADGLLTALPSDTLLFTYMQPNGSSLTYSVSPPPELPD